MPETVDPRFFDRRTSERYLRNGQLDEKEYERYLKTLPDLGERAVGVETVMGTSEEEAVPVRTIIP